MMNFDGTGKETPPTEVVVPDVPTPNSVIACGEFWPDIDPGQCREEMRLDGTVTDQRLRMALVAAITQVQDTLAPWVTTQQENGATVLSDTTTRTVDGVNINEWRFKRAVYCYAAANIQERMRSFDTTAEGHKRADALTDPIDDHRRDGQWAVSDMMGRGRTFVELI